MLARIKKSKIITCRHKGALASTPESTLGCIAGMNWNNVMSVPVQAKVPFSKKTRDYIASLDVERDLSLLAAHGLALRAECTRVFRASSLLLQKAAARRMTPYAIASIMCRDAVSKSWVERLHSHVLQVGNGG